MWITLNWVEFLLFLVFTTTANHHQQLVTSQDKVFRILSVFYDMKEKSLFLYSENWSNFHFSKAEWRMKILYLCNQVVIPSTSHIHNSNFYYSKTWRLPVWVRQTTYTTYKESEMCMSAIKENFPLFSFSFFMLKISLI